MASGDNVGGNFDVPTGLTGIIVELVWMDPQFDLDMRVDATDAADAVPPTANGTTVETQTGHSWVSAGGEPGQPNHAERIEITDADALALAGSWAWTVSPKGPANAVAFTIYVSMFRDMAPGADYTAVPPSGNP